MSRATQATVNLKALRHNLGRVKQLAPKSKTIAVIKADGYGHGIVRAAKALEEADKFGVASLDEALELRSNGIRKPIVLLEGVFEASEFSKAGLQNAEIVIHHISQLEMLEDYARTASSAASRMSVWLKIDTGMHRLGFPPDIVPIVWQRLQAIPLVKEMNVMTHLANADDPKDIVTKMQLQLFDKVTRGLQAPRSIANSGGILGWPETHADYVRPGIMLYGVTPFNSGAGLDHDLQPVMTLSSALIAINYQKKNSAIGYGGEWVCPEDMLVGVVAIGYGDGYPRHAKSGTPVLVNGKRARLIGRVSMDMICVDLREQPDAKAGDPVIVWGDGLPVEEVARCADTIGYELLCHVTQRVKFVEKN
ncbi:MAG: alanine racemase [Gammaproteobacteria bacterium]|nr:alanine racemase [Gammaproteobacteria bacterium]